MEPQKIYLSNYQIKKYKSFVANCIFMNASRKLQFYEYMYIYMHIYIYGTAFLMWQEKFYWTYKCGISICNKMKAILLFFFSFYVIKKVVVQYTHYYVFWISMRCCIFTIIYSFNSHGPGSQIIIIINIILRLIDTSIPVGFFYNGTQVILSHYWQLTKQKFLKIWIPVPLFCSTCMSIPLKWLLVSYFKQISFVLFKLYYLQRCFIFREIRWLWGSFLSLWY